MNTQTENAAIATCENFLALLGWTWHTPRVQVWLKKVCHRLYGRVPTIGILESMPENVFVTLAKILDYRLKCHQLLQLLESNWDSHPNVKQIEQKYGCCGVLPLAGYKELHFVLDDKWLQENVF